MCDDYEGAMACDDTCFYVHVQQREEGASPQRSVSAEVWTVKVVVEVVVCWMCVRHAVGPYASQFQSGEVGARVQTRG